MSHFDLTFSVVARGLHVLAALKWRSRCGCQLEILVSGELCRLGLGDCKPFVGKTLCMNGGKQSQL